MRIQNLPAIIGTALLLSACGSSSTPGYELSPNTIVERPQRNELAHPQPERPLCDFCAVIKGGPAPTTGGDSGGSGGSGGDSGGGGGSGNDELSMELNVEYVGQIDGASLVVYTDTDKTTYSFDQAVIDDLNDSAGAETLVMLDVPDITRGLLVFSLGTETYYEPVRVIEG